MRVLVTYASAGAGHRRVAEAIYAYLKENRGEVDAVLSDILPFTGRLFRFSYSAGYPFLINHAPWLWGFFFWLTGPSIFRRPVRALARMVNYLGCMRFAAYLRRERFDFIISTHFLNSEIAAGLKSKGRISSKLITVITDFGVHPFWVSPGIDIYAVASEATREKLKEMGVADKQAMVSGIPCGAPFLKKAERGSLCSKLGIEQGKFTVLLMTGSFGSGPLEEIAEAVSDAAQVLVVCARNNRLLERMSKKKPVNIKAFGFVGNIEELMGASDIIITKPGGSSIAELLAMGLFPVFISAIPGQEQENVKVLSSCGVGYSCDNVRKVKDFVSRLRDNPAELERLRGNVLKISRPFACREICDVIR